MKEEWRPITGFEDYQVSNLGHVKSLKNGKEKILSLVKSSNGYLQITLFKNGNGTIFKIHRLVA